MMAKRNPASHGSPAASCEYIEEMAALICLYGEMLRMHATVPDITGMGYHLDKVVAYARAAAFVYDDLKKSVVEKAEDNRAA